jgi:hypothetical protein
MDILAALKEEEVKLKRQLTGIQGAIAALSGVHRPASNGRSSTAKITGSKRVMSPAVRAKLSRQAKERWARIKAEKAKKTK